MKVFITGSSGFVGKNLIDKLSSDFELLCPAHQELDLLDEEAVADFFNSQKVDAVIHCANVGATKKTDNLPHIVSNNVRMFLNLARQNNKYKKMIFFGSGSEFDKRQPLVRVTEDYVSPTLPESDYGFSKLLCSHFLEHFDNIINLRIFGVYGRHDDYLNRFVSNAVCRAVLGLPIIVYQDQLMNFIFVDDLVKITEYFLRNQPKHKSYNVAAMPSTSLIKIAESIKEISGKNLKIIIKQTGSANEYTCDTAILQSELQNINFVPMEVSLKLLYDWYEGQKETINGNKLAN
jgi:UDP-glucose 4-epimerase